MKILAQVPQDVGGPFVGLGAYRTGGSAPQDTFALIITRVVGFLTIVAGLYFMFLLITGGISWMASGGDKGKLAAARSKMVDGGVGLAIVVIAIFLVQIVGNLIGLEDPLNIAALIDSIRP